MNSYISQTTRHCIQLPSALKCVTRRMRQGMRDQSCAPSHLEKWQTKETTCRYLDLAFLSLSKSNLSMSSACTCCEAAMYLLYSIANSPLPCKSRWKIQRFLPKHKTGHPWFCQKASSRNGFYWSDPWLAEGWSKEPRDKFRFGVAVFFFTERSYITKSQIRLSTCFLK